MRRRLLVQQRQQPTPTQPAYDIQAVQDRTSKQRAADRARRYRDRIRKGVAFATAEVPVYLVQALVRRGLLPDAPKLDAHQIGRALVEYARRAEDEGA